MARLTDRLKALLPARATSRFLVVDFDSRPMRIVLAEGGPFHARGFLKDYVKRLEATERGDAVAELRRRHPREFAG